MKNRRDQNDLVYRCLSCYDDFGKNSLCYPCQKDIEEIFDDAGIVVRSAWAYYELLWLDIMTKDNLAKRGDFS